MPFHVYVFEQFATARGRGRTGQGYYFTNLTGDDLQARIVEPWERGSPMMWSGRTADPMRTLSIEVYETQEAIPRDAQQSDAYRLMQEGENVTNQWILAAAGARAGEPAAAVEPVSDAAAARKDPRRVMVVHGRNLRAREAMFMFLRSLGLDPIEWEDAVAETGMGAPYTLEAVQAAMDVAQAVVVILTAEDQAGLLPSLADSEQESALEGQPRQNVMIEAGMAIGAGRAGTILVEIGQIRSASDFHGINTVRLTNEPESRTKLRNRLRIAGCEVDDQGTDWLSSPSGGDFAVAVPWQSRSLADAPQSSDQLRTIAAILGTELRDIRTKIERVKATSPPSYPFAFRLPTGRFTEYESVLAEDAGVYAVVSRAYTAAHHVNEALYSRESRQSPGDRGRIQLGAIPEDGLDAAHAAAGEALDALSERHNDPLGS